MRSNKPAKKFPINQANHRSLSVTPPWSEVADDDRLANGLVLAMHCVPSSVDPSVEAFWSALSKALKERGHALLLLSTATVIDADLYVLNMPFEMTAFARTYARKAYSEASVSEQAVDETMAWYNCDRAEAVENLCLAEAFLRDVLDELRPMAVLGWQGLNPLTRLLRQLCTITSLPFWSAERGWVRNTLMFDLGGAHLLSEVGASLALSRQKKRYMPSSEVLDQLQKRATGSDQLARYAQKARISRSEMRVKLCIPQDAPVAVLFTHGEPAMNAMADSLVRQIHDISTEKLQLRADAVTEELEARGFYVLVQEHPFNAPAGRTLRLRQSLRVIGVQENVSSLIDAADCCLFTLSTLQFDAIFFDKPVGLLSRSALCVDHDPPFIGDYPTVQSFVDALMNLSDWPMRWQRLRSHIAYIYENFLIDLEESRRADGVREWAEHLIKFQRPVDSNFGVRLGIFLKRWKMQ